MTTAVLFATAPAGDGGPAAALRGSETTLLGRLLGQLAEQGIRDAHVITRPEWVDALRSRADGHGVSVLVEPSPDGAADLRAVAAVARREPGGLVVANADVLTQGEALAGLLADPRITTGVLATTVRKVQREMAFRARGRRGRVLSAATPYPYVHQPNSTFLGVIKVAPVHREALAGVAASLAGLVEGPLPDGWREELDAKFGRWKLAVHRRALSGVEPSDTEDEPPETDAPAEDDLEDPELTAAGRRAVARGRRRAAAPARGRRARRAVAAAVRARALRRPGRHEPPAQAVLAPAADRGGRRGAAARIGEHDEDRALLDSAVKANDGFFTTFFVSPYSKYIARWAARRGWTPNGVTTISVAVGFMAAAAFATGERTGMIAGALLLQAAFTLDCVDGQLARYTRTFSKFGAWLDSIFDRTKEYAVFAGLAIGASRTGDDVWVLAGAALALQTLRHSIDFSFPVAQYQGRSAVRQPPLEQVQDVVTPTVPAPVAAGVEDAAPPPAPPPRMRRSHRLLHHHRRPRHPPAPSHRN